MKHAHIVLAVGGTGGHLFPAIGLAEELKMLYPSIKISFIGGNLAVNPYFNTTSYPFHSISTAHFFSKNPFRFAKNMLKNAHGLYQSLKYFYRSKPDLIVGFGSYHSFAPLLSAYYFNLPLILFESNSLPGKVVRFFSKRKVPTAIAIEEAKKHLASSTYASKMPLRKSFYNCEVTKSKALSYFGLQDDKKTLLIFGGSQGAHFINNLIAETMTFLKDNGHGDFFENIQLIHLTGNTEEAKAATHLYHSLGIKASVKPFESAMELAWQAADLIISRSGAATIAEMLHFKIPAIFIPYPHAADNHQLMNANYISNTIKGAITLQQQEAHPSKLAQLLTNLMMNRIIGLTTDLTVKKQNQLKQMKTALTDYQKDDNIPSLVEVILNFLNNRLLA